MSQAKTQKTIDEKVMIVQDYLNADPKMTYKELGEKYDESLSTVYSWVRKYREDGREGLKDRRGQCICQVKSVPPSPTKNVPLHHKK